MKKKKKKKFLVCQEYCNFDIFDENQSLNLPSHFIEPIEFYIYKMSYIFNFSYLNLINSKLGGLDTLSHLQVIIATGEISQREIGGVKPY